jgi:hypothetical protein
MTTLHCELFKKDFKVKKVCKRSEMPKSAVFYTTIFFNKQSQDIYTTPSRQLYANVKINY